MRSIILSAQAFIDTIQGKVTPVSNFSADTELLDLKFDLLNNQVTIIVRSENFEDIPETYPIPELKNDTGIVSKIRSPIQVTPKTSSNIKNESTKTTAPINNYAAKMAEEFIPEQRKLLSFSANEDTVIVKPIQFLKDEWDEINETVKSLGGKWVKGDIVSYWAIPIQ